MPGSPSGSTARGAATDVRRSGARALRSAVGARVRAAQHGRHGRACVAALACGLIAAAPATADTKSFTQPGCSQWTVPAAVSSVAIDASGAAGVGARGGQGGEVTGSAAVTHGQTL